MISSFESTVAVMHFIFVTCAHLTFAVPLSYYDIREHRLPNKLTLALNGAVLSTAAIGALIAPELDTRVLGACIIALVVGALTFSVALFFPASLGMGDAKVTPATVLLAALGGAPVLLGALAWVCGAGAISALWVLMRTKSTKTRFAFGPIILSAPYGGLALTLLGIF